MKKRLQCYTDLSSHKWDQHNIYSGVEPVIISSTMFNIM